MIDAAIRARWIPVLTGLWSNPGVNFIRQTVLMGLPTTWMGPTIRAARLATAVAHEHARRLGAREWRLYGAPYVPFCPHHERPEACWPCYVEANP